MWDAFSDWLGTLNWGDVPGWVGLILAGVAAAIALVTYRHSVAVRAEAQARLVYATRTETEHLDVGAAWDPQGAIGSAGDAMFLPGVFPWRLSRAGVQVLVTVHNGSDEPLPLAVVQIGDTGMKRRVSAWASFGVVPPRSESRQWILFPDWHGHPNRAGAYNVYVAFQDSSGRWWEREEGGIIRRIKRDPSP